MQAFDFYDGMKGFSSRLMMVFRMRCQHALIDRVRGRRSWNGDVKSQMRFQSIRELFFAKSG